MVRTRERLTERAIHPANRYSFRYTPGSAALPLASARPNSGSARGLQSRVEIGANYGDAPRSPQRHASPSANGRFRVVANEGRIPACSGGGRSSLVGGELTSPGGWGRGVRLVTLSGLAREGESSPLG